MLEIRGETRDDVDARQDNDPHKDVEESSNTGAILHQHQQKCTSVTTDRIIFTMQNYFHCAYVSLDLVGFQKV